MHVETNIYMCTIFLTVALETEVPMTQVEHSSSTSPLPTHLRQLPPAQVLGEAPTVRKSQEVYPGTLCQANMTIENSYKKKNTIRKEAAVMKQLADLTYWPLFHHKIVERFSSYFPYVLLDISAMIIIFLCFHSSSFSSPVQEHLEAFGLCMHLLLSYIVETIVDISTLLVAVSTPSCTSYAKFP